MISKPILRSIAALTVVLSALFVLGTPSAGAASKPKSPHVARAGERAYIADRAGREILLRGINSNALVQYPDYFQQTVKLRRSDLREMAALGFNFLRLPINWSLLEPAPDRFSRSYLKSIRVIVARARKLGIRVLIDFHQDRYNRNLRPGDEADGAPDWATLTDGHPCEGSSPASPCFKFAFDNFWNNTEVDGKPLQTYYLEAMVKVSRALRREKSLLGFELMNEPTPGSTASPAFEREQLWPFNLRMIKGLRKSGETRMIWFGPNFVRDVVDFDVGNPEKFSDDGNLIYAPHIYTGTFNGGGPDELRASVAAAAEEAKLYDAPWVDAEWGGGTSEKDESMRLLKLDLLDEYRAGSAFWMWKQKPGFYNWQTVNPDGGLRDDSMRAQQLSRPHLDVVPGRLLSTSNEDGRLKAKIRSKGGNARIWSGTVVKSGGETAQSRPLLKAFVNDKAVRIKYCRKDFTNDVVSLRGYRIHVKLPRGKQELELRPGRFKRR